MIHSPVEEVGVERRGEESRETMESARAWVGRAAEGATAGTWDELGRRENGR